MERPPDNVIPGYEVTHIECRGCGRKVEWPETGNRLVGCHDRMRCKACGHRGADMHRVWHVGKRPGADVISLAPRQSST